MSSKRILGIAGAAMMGTVAGTGAVHAVIGISTSGTTGAPTFALETMRSDREVEPRDGNGGPFYEVAANTGASGELDLRVPIKISVPVSTSALITIDLEDLVFTGAPTPSLIVSPATVADPPANITGVTPSVVSGGGRGDKRVQFGFTTDATNMVPDDAVLLVTIGRLGADPDTPGSITVTASRTFAGERIADFTRLPDAVKVARALNVTVTPQNQTASVEEGFMKFKSGDGVSGDQLAAQVGKLLVGIATTTPATTFYNAGRGDVASSTLRPGEVSLASHIASEVAITFTGETAFLADDDADDPKKRVYVGDVDCDPVGSSIMDEDGMLKSTLPLFDNDGDNNGEADDNGGAYLCLKVDGKTVIPVTEAYTVAIAYTSALGANAQFAPANMPATPLGSIGRDGSTVNIAYLTTNRRYNQRLVMVNRSGDEVEVKMTFDAAPGTTADPTTLTRMVPRGRTNLKVSDLVTFTNASNPNGGSGSAVLSADVTSTMFDVVTVTATIGDDSTDTVVWPATQ